jgi:hypothetical protein
MSNQRVVWLTADDPPGAFPPVALKVEADGKIYTELQVDGGTTANSFVAPLNASLPRETANRRKSIFVVQSGKLVPDYQTVNPQTLKLAGRAIKTLLKYKNFADIRRLYLLARQTGANFRMISVPESFDRTSKEPFDKAYMNELYELGYKMGRHGSAWVTRPDVF